MSTLFTRFAGWCAWAAGHPLAFVLASATCIVWAVTGPIFHYSDTWQLVINTGTTVLTFLMVFVLQHSQNTDAIAIQAKLDELIMHTKNARNDLIEAEKLTEQEVELLRQHRAECGIPSSRTDGGTGPIVVHP
jgi:low affinity Fe/Cu permease